MPIIYASDAFLLLTGYSREEILGCNFRFLNSPGTSMEVLEEINQHICSDQACTVDLLNYRKDGSSFRDLLHVSPIRDASGKVRLHLSQVFPGRSCTWSSDASVLHLSNDDNDINNL
uniref:PAS domain-containing protein n=1 Tax=Arundo donax TaxID=35708 RepID=A0A0A9GHZ6_ARUDO